MIKYNNKILTNNFNKNHLGKFSVIKKAKLL